MRNTILSLAILPMAAFGQVTVPTTPMDRTVLLEQYSAINCGNCPAGHTLAENIAAANPGQVELVEVHGGGLAVPSTGQPDFRNTWATQLWSFYSVASQPRGPVNRVPYSGQLIMSTSLWTNATNAQLLLPSPVNIGVGAQFDDVTRDLSVDVGLHYTADGSGGTDRICVLLTESHIIGYQQDYVNGAQANFDHLNILRAYITDLWGDEVLTTTMGTSVQRSYSFNVPVDWDIANCRVIAFVGEYQGELYQTHGIGADAFSTGVPDVTTASPFGAAYPVPASDVLRIPVYGTDGNVPSVFDASGRQVTSLHPMIESGVIVLDVSDLAVGTYSYGAAGKAMRRFTVIH